MKYLKPFELRAFLFFAQLPFTFQIAFAYPIDAPVVHLCNELNTAALSGDFERVFELTYPKVLASVGRDKMIGLLKDVVAGKPGFHVTGIECESPTQRSNVGSTKFALLPITTVANVSGKPFNGKGIFRQPGSLLAISNDQEKTWTFININPGMTVDQLKPWLPHGIGAIVLPPNQDALFIPDDFSKTPVAELTLPSSNAKPDLDAERDIPVRWQGPDGPVSTLRIQPVTANCKPDYPKEAILKNEQGTVKLEFEIAADAHLLGVTVLKSSGFTELDIAGVNGLSRCKFRASMKNGKPEQSSIKVDYVWKIED